LRTPSTTIRKLHWLLRDLPPQRRLLPRVLTTGLLPPPPWWPPLLHPRLGCPQWK